MKSLITKFVLITILSFMGYAVKLNAQCNNNTCGITNNSTSTAFNSGKAVGISSFVVGPMSESYSFDASIIGARSEISTSADHSHIFGYHNFIYDGSSKAFIFGSENTINSNSENAIAIGFGNNTGGNSGYNISLGHQNTTNAEMTLALGKGNILNGENSAALGLGLQTSSSAHHSIALGFGTETFESYSLAFAAGSRTPAIYVKGNADINRVGNVGIANKNPLATLDISGDMRISGETNSVLFALDPGSILSDWGIQANVGGGLTIFQPGTDNSQRGEGEEEPPQVIPTRHRFYIDGQAGNVGINTTRPQHQLSVDGNIMVSSNNGSLLFTDDPMDPEATWGKWGIEYHNGGLNFWRPHQGIGGTGKSGDNTDNTLNYALFLEDKEGYVGIQTSEPKERFQIGDRWTFHDGGNKLIGYNWDWDEDALISKRIVTDEACWIKFKTDGAISFGSAESGDASTAFGDAAQENLLIRNNGELRVLNLENTSLTGMNRLTTVKSDGTLTSSESILIKNDGAIGIGLDPTDHYAKFKEDWNQYTLYVNGGIMSSEIWVKIPDQWSDFVFEDNYRLRPLSEVEEFIINNGHLPEIPSAEQVAEEGINMGQMDAKLLQKIEELTLYVIEQDKKIESLVQELKELKNNK